MKTQNKISKQTYFVLGFLLIWAILNLLSAAFTGLAHDEAYYWMYSQNLDWGFYDHPPAIAIMIKAGYFLFENAFGLRLVNVLTGCVSLFLLWKICTKYGEDFLLFVSLISGIIIFHVYGFIVVPDGPLLASSIFYFWALEKYLNSDRIKFVLILALSIAIMLYSKYHGFLILLFTIIATPEFLKKRSFWLIALFSLILFLPHIIWQIENNYPSLQYHLLGRGNRAYTIFFSLNYFLGLLLISGPLIGIILWYAVFKVRITSTWERILKFNVLGVVIFFFFSSFHSKIEPNWNIPVVIPLLILSYKYLKGKFTLRKWVIILGGVTFVIGLFFRVYFATDIIFKEVSTHLKVRNEFHNWDLWAYEIAEKAQDRPVVFLNSYQKASKYTYYTKNLAHSYNGVNYRKNQFDLWDTETKIQGKNVLIVLSRELPNFSLLETAVGDFYISELKNFRSYNKVEIDVLNDEWTFEANTTYPLEVMLTNNFPFSVNFQENKDFSVEIVVSLIKYKQLIEEQSFPLKFDKDSLNTGETFIQIINYKAPQESGSYQIFVSLKSNYLEPGINYKNKNLIVE
ncbi:MAG: ArnT family glycosyltransferase [Bacteroidota bacterium]